MKKFFTFCLIGSLCTGAYAQTNLEGRHETKVGYGLLPVQEIATLIGDGVLMGIAGRQIDKSNGSGVISAAYSYSLSSRLAVGATGFWGNTTVTYKDALGGSKWNIFGAMADAQFNYLNKEKFRLYSRGSVGYARYNNRMYGQPNSGFGNVAFQAIPIGVRYGKKVAIFGEAGFGYLGFVNAGLAISI